MVDYLSKKNESYSHLGIKKTKIDLNPSEFLISPMKHWPWRFGPHSEAGEVGRTCDIYRCGCENGPAISEYLGKKQDPKNFSLVHFTFILENVRVCFLFVCLTEVIYMRLCQITYPHVAFVYLSQ